jgi:hypothetical protein
VAKAEISPDPAAPDLIGRRQSCKVMRMIKLGHALLGLNQDHLRAHSHCAQNRAELRSSSQCGCFYCLAIFPPTDVTEWVGGEDTALCAKCGIDSVIGSASGYPITVEFLQRMHDYWF